MYKRIINCILLVLSIFFIARCEIYNNSGFEYCITAFIIPLLFSITFVLFSKRKDKGHIYNIITLLLMFISCGIFICTIVGTIKNMIELNITIFSTSGEIFDLLYPHEYMLTYFSIFTLLIMNITDHKTKLNTMNFILTVLVSLITIFTFIRNYNISSITNHDSTFLVEYESYIYISILNICLLIHYFVNRKKTL